MNCVGKRTGNRMGNYILGHDFCFGVEMAVEGGVLVKWEVGRVEAHVFGSRAGRKPATEPQPSVLSIEYP